MQKNFYHLWEDCCFFLVDDSVSAKYTAQVIIAGIEAYMLCIYIFPLPLRLFLHTVTLPLRLFLQIFPLHHRQFLHAIHGSNAHILRPIEQRTCCIRLGKTLFWLIQLSSPKSEQMCYIRGERNVIVSLSTDRSFWSLAKNIS